MEIISVKVTQKILNDAKDRNEQYKKKYGNCGTHRLNSDRQRMTGYLAEAAIVDIFSGIKYSNNDNVDFLFGSITLDSKAQGCNSKPLSHYTATLYEEQKFRPVDYYIFSRVKNDFSIVWICGLISKQKFFNIAKLAPSGTETNNFVYDQSRYEIEYNQLENIKNFVEKSYEKI